MSSSTNKITLRLDLHPAQMEVYEGLRRFNVLRCGRRWGKTVLTMAWLAEGALKGETVAYTAPTYKMLMEFWRETKQTLRDVIATVNETEKRLSFITGGAWDFWSLDNADALRGRKYHRIANDEAAMNKDFSDAWNMVLRPTLTDYKGKALFPSTPKGRNDFYELSELAKLDEEWTSWHMPTVSNPYIDPKEVEAARLSMPDIAFRQEYLAEFIDVAGALVKREHLNYAERAPSNLTIGMGVDLAISKTATADYTAIAVVGYDRESGRRYVLDMIRKQAEFHEVLTMIRKMAEKWEPVKINIEQVQYQAAVVQELLRKTNLPVKGVKPDKDKVTRFFPILAQYEQGNVYHLRGLPNEFENELLGFPETKNDDMVDALVYASDAAHSKKSIGAMVL